MLLTHQLEKKNQNLYKYLQKLEELNEKLKQLQEDNHREDVMDLLAYEITVEIHAQFFKAVDAAVGKNNL